MLLAAAVTLALSNVAAAQANQPAAEKKAAPKLVIESFDYDAGLVKESVKVEHTFKVKNEGQANLEILRVAPS
jgi:hypothetical protein